MVSTRQNLSPYIKGAEFMYENSFFGAVKLTKVVDPDKYFYSRYGIGFDACESLVQIWAHSCILIIKRTVSFLYSWERPTKWFRWYCFDCREKIFHKFYWETEEIYIAVKVLKYIN